MKKVLPYIIVLLVLGAGVGYFVYEYSPSTLEKKESSFAVRNIDDVTKVILTDRKGVQLTLTKKGKKWISNDKYDANEEAQALLFTAIQKMQVDYPVPANAQPHVLKDMVSEGVKCEIYIGGDKPGKVFYIGGSTTDGKGTYAIMEVDGQMARRPYVVHIPGIDAYLTGRFSTDGEFWRSRWICRDNDADIKSLSVKYNLEKQKSFSINRVDTKDSFVIANSDGQVADQPKQRFIKQYLGFFEALSLEFFDNKNAGKDTLLQGEPFCTVDLRRNDDTETKVEIFYMPVTEKSRVQFDDNGRKLIYDVERYYVGLNDRKDLGVIQYFVWGKALRSYSDFFVRPTAPAKPHS